MVDVREIDGAIAEIENSELTMTRVKNLAALYVVKNQRLADASHYIAGDDERTAKNLQEIFDRLVD